MDIAGSTYTRNTSLGRVIELFNATDGGHGALVFKNGGLADRSATVIIGKNNKVTFPYLEKISLQILPASGVFKGTFRQPDTGKLISFRGAILQEQNYGAGLFLNGGLVGETHLVPPSSNP